MIGNHRKRALALAALAITAGCAGVPPARMRTTAAPPPPGTAGPGAQTVQALQARVEQLERRIAALTLGDDAADAIVAGAAPAANAPVQNAQKVQSAQNVQNAPNPNAPNPSALTANTDVTDDDLNRALSRTLVEQGGLVLPPWLAEISPEVEYTYKKTDGLRIFTANGQPTIGQSDLRRDTATAAVTGRLGLPWSSQVEARVPFVYDRFRETVPGRDRSDSDIGVGDVQVTLSKQLLREQGALPDLLAALSWRAPTGKTRIAGTVNQPSLGSGYHSVRGSLTAVKTQDPLAFFGSLSYAKNFETTVDGNRLKPGDSVGARLGTILAVSPETSLRAAIDTEFYNSSTLNGVKVPGSDQAVSELELGVATVLSPELLMNITAGVGLTSGAPDFRIGVSFPYRFPVR